MRVAVRAPLVGAAPGGPMRGALNQRVGLWGTPPPSGTARGAAGAAGVSATTSRPALPRPLSVVDRSLSQLSPLGGYVFGTALRPAECDITASTGTSAPVLAIPADPHPKKRFGQILLQLQSLFWPLKSQLRSLLRNSKTRTTVELSLPFSGPQSHSYCHYTSTSLVV